MISINGLYKNFGNVKALEDINIEIKEGQIIGLLGPNGSGKTTLLKILAGLYKEYDGEVIINGHSPSGLTKSITSYLPDKSVFPKKYSVEKISKIYKNYYNDFEKNDFDDMLKAFDIKEDEIINEMSKGKVDKLNIALALARRANIYLLDEPIGGVDVKAREIVLNKIIEKLRPEATIIVVTHLINDIEKIFDSVIMLDKGEIVYYDNCDKLRLEYGKSLENIIRECYYENN
jgi:ABC-2 type transport system ATP-binding protein